MTKVTDRTAVEVWMEVIAWLTEAADLGSTQIGRRPQHYCLGLGAELLAEKAVRLLQDADRARLDEVGLPAAAAVMRLVESPQGCSSIFLTRGRCQRSGWRVPVVTARSASLRAWCSRRR